MTAEQSLQDFQREINSKELFLPPVNSHEETIQICQFHTYIQQ